MAKIEIDPKMYLFTGTRTRTDFASRLVISAHGGIDRHSQPQFQIKHGTLHFYSAHGVTTEDRGIREFVYGGRATQRVESLNAGTMCYDYSLSKYQGRHASRRGQPAETYDDIVNAQEYVDEYQEYVDEFNQAFLAVGANAPPCTSAAGDFDVLTIRYRWWGHDVPLQEVFKAVTLSQALEAVAIRHQYTDIHCYFCRSFM